MNIYRYLDYREAIEKLLESRKKENSKVNFSRLAEALGIQSTYISRVLKGNAHFSSDQLFLICDFLGLDEEEHQFLQLLLDYERTGVASRRKKFLEQIRAIQSERTQIQKHLRAKMVEAEATEKYLDYYLDPLAPLVHVYFSIANYRLHPEKIREALDIPDLKFKKTLANLERLSIIKWNAPIKQYDLLIDQMHLPKESPLSFPAEQLSRLMVIDHLKNLPMGQRFYYSVTFSADEKTRALIHQEILKLLAKCETEIKAAPGENVYYLSMDLFPWQIGDG